jgi:large subunit ribosomal protein L30
MTVAEAKKSAEAPPKTAGKTAEAAGAGTLKITWIRSWIGYDKGQRETITSLGLHRLHQTVEKPNNPQVRGQINKVKHMLEVEGL